jgi:hypothetical protein
MQRSLLKTIDKAKKSMVVRAAARRKMAGEVDAASGTD